MLIRLNQRERPGDVHIYFMNGFVLQLILHKLQMQWGEMEVKKSLQSLMGIEHKTLKSVAIHASSFFQGVTIHTKGLWQGQPIAKDKMLQSHTL